MVIVLFFLFAAVVPCAAVMLAKDATVSVHKDRPNFFDKFGRSISYTIYNPLIKSQETISVNSISFIKMFIGICLFWLGGIPGIGCVLLGIAVGWFLFMIQEQIVCGIVLLLAVMISLQSPAVYYIDSSYFTFITTAIMIIVAIFVYRLCNKKLESKAKEKINARIQHIVDECKAKFVVDSAAHRIYKRNGITTTPQEAVDKSNLEGMNAGHSSYEFFNKFYSGDTNKFYDLVDDPNLFNFLNQYQVQLCTRDLAYEWNEAMYIYNSGVSNLRQEYEDRKSGRYEARAKKETEERESRDKKQAEEDEAALYKELNKFVR